MINKIIEFIRFFNIDIIIDIITLILSMYAVLKQRAKLLIETLNGNYFIDYSKGTDKYGNEYIEILPFVRIINQSQLPISIYSIEIILDNSKKTFKIKESYKKVKKIEFYNRKNSETLVIKNILDFSNPINLEAYQLISGYLDLWINGSIKDLENAKILIKTSRKNYIKKIKFKEIDSDCRRNEIHK